MALAMKKPVRGRLVKVGTGFRPAGKTRGRPFGTGKSKITKQLGQRMRSMITKSARSTTRKPLPKRGAPSKGSDRVVVKKESDGPKKIVVKPYKQEKPAKKVTRATSSVSVKREPGSRSSESARPHVNALLEKPEIIKFNKRTGRYNDGSAPGKRGRKPTRFLPKPCQKVTKRELRWINEQRQLTAKLQAELHAVQMEKLKAEVAEEAILKKEHEKVEYRKKLKDTAEMMVTKFERDEKTLHEILQKKFAFNNSRFQRTMITAQKARAREMTNEQRRKMYAEKKEAKDKEYEDSDELYRRLKAEVERENAEKRKSGSVKEEGDEEEEGDAGAASSSQPAGAAMQPEKDGEADEGDEEEMEAGGGDEEDGDADGAAAPEDGDADAANNAD